MKDSSLLSILGLNTTHIQASLQFDLDHNLWVAVAGTGHDFMNRHSCDDGVFIRTALMKDIEWDINDTKGFGHPDGSVKLGGGIVFAEALSFAALN